AVPELTLAELFAQAVAVDSTATALVFGADRVSYGELDVRATRLASQLVAAGVRRGDVVGVLFERGIEFAVAVLAVVKSGAGYTLLDPDFPDARLAGALADIGVGVVVSDAGLADRLSGVRIVVIDPEAAAVAELPVASADDVACVMFTSGSTGRPKGVMAPHRALVGTLLGQDYASFGPGEVFVQCSPVSWDAFSLEFWGALGFGGTCVLHPGQRPEPAVLAGLVAEHGVTMLQLSSSLFNFLVDEVPAAFAGVRLAFTGGEAASAAHVTRALTTFPELTVANGYGPAESMGFTTTHVVSADVTGSVPVGKPLANKRVYVLDAGLLPTPIGVAGEVCLAGIGLADGYANRAGLSAERFLADSVVACGERMYRTGDIARWTADGVLEFVGRADGQVKIRGFRVEPGEVEAVLVDHESVTQAAVVAWRDGDEPARLVAYVVGGVDGRALREWAGESLPEHMVPAAIVVLDRLPVTANGKLDRAALPAPEFGGGEGRAPRTAREEILAGLFADVLGMPVTSVDDGFFDLGGHSLLAARLVARVRGALGVEIGVRDVFRTPTVAGLAARLGQLDGVALRPAITRAQRPERVPLSYAQRRLWFVQRLEGLSSAYNVPLALRLTGALDLAALELAVGDLMDRHEVLRTIFPDVDGEPHQLVLDDARPEFVVRDDTTVDALANETFDLTTDLPIRVTVLRAGPDEHVLVVLLHHIATDGWSTAPLLRDLTTAYAARCTDTTPDQAPLPVQYADYALWQRGQLSDEDSEFWRTALDGMPQVIDLPIDRPRPAVSTHRGAGLTVELDADAHNGLVRLATSQGATLAMALQAGLAVTLARLGAGYDVPIATAVAGRSDEALDDVVGFFVNTLVMRTDLAGNPSFGELVARVREWDLAAYDRQEMPFDLVVEACNPVRSLAWHPLVQVMLTVQNNEAAESDFAGLAMDSVVTQLATTKFDLMASCAEQRDADGAPAGIAVWLEYATDLFDATTVRLLGDIFLRVLRAMGADATGRVDDVDVVSADEYRMLVTDRAAVRGHTARMVAGAARDDTARSGTTMSPRQEILARLFAEVLGKPVGVRDNFFRSGGHSLLAVRLASRIRGALGVEVGVRDLFGAPTVLGLDARVGELSGQPARAAMMPMPRPERIPLSYAQRRLWFVHRLEGRTSAYNVSMALRLTGALDQAALEAAVADVTTRHEVLRTRFPAIDGEPYQQILPTGPTVRHQACGTADVEAVVAALTNETFDLATDLPIRVTVLRVGPTEHVLVILLHHIATDGWSTGPLLRDLTTAYAARCAGATPTWTPLPVQYADYALWQREQLSDEDKEFWQQTLAGLPPVLDLPFDRPRPAVATHRGDGLPATLDAELHAGLVRLAAITGSTLFMLLQTGLAVLLRQLGAGTDIPVAAAVAGRSDEALDDVVGFFVNTLVMRTDLAGNPSFAELVARVREWDLAAYDRQEMPFDLVVEACNPVRSLAWHPLAQIMLTLQNTGRADATFGDLAVDSVPARLNDTKFDLMVSATEAFDADTPAGLDLWFEYATDVFDATTVRLLADLFGRVLRLMVTDSAARVDEITVLTAGERTRLDARRDEVRARTAELITAATETGSPAHAMSITPRQEILARLFGEVLGKPVGVRDNFFRSGGHSLLAVRLASRIRAALGVEVGVRDLFRAPTVVGLDVRITELAGLPVRPPLVLMARPDVIPLSHAQRRLWFLGELAGANQTYNVSVVLRLSGSLAADALAAALGDVVGRHEVLRTVFPSVDGEPFQVVLGTDEVRVPLTVTDLGTDEPALAAAVSAATNHTFDLSGEIPIRAWLLGAGPDEHVLIVLMHHIAGDGWSMGPLLGDLATAYQARLLGSAPNWQPLPVQYADYTLWQYELLGEASDEDSVLAGQLKFWRETLAGAPEVIELPTDRPRPVVAGQRGDIVPFELDADVHAALLRVAAQTGATLFMVVQAAFALLLSRLGAGTDIPIGTAVAGRLDEALDELVGFFVNTIVLRTDVSGEVTFAELVARVRDADLAVFDHQDLPFDLLVEAVNPTRSTAHHPLFQVMLL
ncbi:MAG TPA: amino acid adenylation domain-containing protein, partial [Pseudonocardiaceae bacterium]|nr:amino acid adenylation domain-containing protein [Pseudonocardiaceae bacterium]